MPSETRRWIFDRDKNQIRDKHGNLVVDLDGSDFGFGEDAEHGLLMAAAPDLLDACRAAYRALDHARLAWESDEMVEAMARIEAAVKAAGAEGGGS